MTLTFPSGAIRTIAPWGVPFGISWSEISQWNDEIEAASAEAGVPPERIASHVPIESAGNPRAIQKNASNGWSYGLMQIVPYGVGWKGWHELVGRIAGIPNSANNAAAIVDALYDPAINLRVGAAILRDRFDQYRDWDKASSAYFLGNPDWRGADTVNGNTGAAYRASLNGLMEELSVTDAINWEPISWPAMRRAIVVKPADGAGFYRVAPRGPRIVGSCNHITDGVPAGDQIEWYRRFFGTGGERAWDALTDTVIATNGEIGILNDWRDNNWGGTRAGWANGTTDGLEGDGVAFFRWYPAINDVLVSKEHVTVTGRKLTDAQMASSIAFSAANAQAVKCPWDSYPYHPGKHGVNIEQMHRNFAPKACPAEPFISTHYPVLVREVKAILTKHQTGSTNPGTPAPEPEPEGGYPFGFGQDAMEFFFGTLTRYDGSEFGFDPVGPISLLWLARCREEGKFPEAESWSTFSGRDVVQWEGGWTLVREGSDPRSTWTWLDKGAPSPTLELPKAA